MPDTPHSELTGADLHEPKGVAAAAADLVYVSDGAASGGWQKIDRDQLEKTGNPFGAHLLHLQYLLSPAVAGLTVSAATWTKIPLNTVATNEISSSALASNQISLPAGTYFLNGTALGTGNYLGKTRLYNATDSATTVVGDLGGNGSATGSATVVLPISGRFTIASTKVFEWQVWYYNGGALGPVGLTSYSSADVGSVNNILSTLHIYKIV